MPCAIVALLTLMTSVVLGAPGFVHPGLLHSRADLERMQRAVAAKQEPIYAGFATFRASPASQRTYRLRGPAAEIGRSPNVAFAEFDSDANAAYQCALMGWITGDRAYFDLAKEILNAWSGALQRVSGADAVLMAGLGPFKMVNAAELLRAADAGWTAGDVARAQRMFRDVIYATLKDFAPFANGNWDTAAIKTMAAIAVFCDDRGMFERALRYYVAGWGNGALTHYVINADGQCQESGRDMPHTQLGLAHLGDTCEIAWHQGLDLYGAEDNRLLRGFEYTARYNLGEDVPFVPTIDRTGKYRHVRISTIGRGRLRPVFEQIYHHYVSRRGLAAPWTEKAAAKLRPEGAGFPGADHPGYGTLLFTRTPADAAAEAAVVLPRPPAALIAEGAADAVRLRWIPALGATHYEVERASGDSDDWMRVDAGARDMTSAGCVDARVTRGAAYRYRVFAVNARGRSEPCFPATITAGLPQSAKVATLGNVTGSAQFDGAVLTLEVGGAGIGGARDAAVFACLPRSGDVAVTVRYVPQVTSQFSQFGLSMRESAAADARSASVVFVPDHRRETERPGWSVRLLARGAAVTGPSEQRLGAPVVTYGRLVAPYWLRLQRRGDEITASGSADGGTWVSIGTVTLPLPERVLVGVIGCSGIPDQTTTMRWDSLDAR